MGRRRRWRRKGGTETAAKQAGVKAESAAGRGCRRGGVSGMPELQTRDVDGRGKEGVGAWVYSEGVRV